MSAFTDDPDTWDEDEWTRRLEACCTRILEATGKTVDPMVVAEAVNSDLVTLTTDGETVFRDDRGPMILDALDEIRALTGEGS